jgi:hypothetical protein
VRRVEIQIPRLYRIHKAYFSIFISPSEVDVAAMKLN